MVPSQPSVPPLHFVSLHGKECNHKMDRQSTPHDSQRPTLWRVKRLLATGFSQDIDHQMVHPIPTFHKYKLDKKDTRFLPGGIDFGVKKVYKSPKSIHRADAKGLTSSSKLSVSCVLTLQTLPLITFTPSYTYPSTSTSIL